MTVVEEMPKEQTKLHKEIFDVEDNLIKSLVAEEGKDIESKFQVSKVASDERNPKKDKRIGGRRR